MLLPKQSTNLPTTTFITRVLELCHHCPGGRNQRQLVDAISATITDLLTMSCFHYCCDQCQIYTATVEGTYVVCPCCSLAYFVVFVVHRIQATKRS